MASDGHQSRFANSLFPAYQHQASVNVGGGNSDSVVLPFSIPNVSLQEQDTASYVPWSHNAHDDPYGLISLAQRSTKSRKPTDDTDCDAETDLFGLVSNILDEADSQDSYYSEGNLSTCNPIWSPKTLSEELFQYFQSEDKTQHNPTFPPNFVPCETLSRAWGQSLDKDVEDRCQQFNDLATSQQWFFDLPNEDKDSYTPHPQTLPPGLPVPNTGNTYLSQKQQSKYCNMLADKDRGNTQPVNNFPDLGDGFRPQSKMNNPFFYPYYEDHYIQSSAKPISNEQCVPQDNNQLVSRFQSFTTGEHGNLCHGDFPYMHRQTVDMHHEDSIDEQWKVTSSAMSRQSTPTIQTQKQLVGEFGTMPMERNGEVWNQTLKCDAFGDRPGFSPQNTPSKYYQEPNPFTESFKLPNRHQNKTTVHRENTSLPMSMNPYSKNHIQQGHIQSKIQPQMQEEKKRMQMSGFSTRPLTNFNMRGGDKKQDLPQNPNFDHLGSMQSQRFDGEKSILGAGNIQQLMPLTYPVNDPRRHSNANNLSSRSTLPYGNGVPGRDIGDMMSANESAAFNYSVSNMMTHKGQSTYHGMASATTNSKVNKGGPVIQLYFYLEECHEQWKGLEKERKRTETLIAKKFLRKRIAAATTNLPKTPLNPTRVDHLIVNLMREQSKVASLLNTMECLHNIPLHISIHTALNKHSMAICITQERRKEEFANMSKYDKAHFMEARDTLLLAIALKELAPTTRKLRTALWCALQMTLLKPVKRQDHHVNREATDKESCPSPFEGYSFTL